jgi:hypothetical protein
MRTPIFDDLIEVPARLIMVELDIVDGTEVGDDIHNLCLLLG